MQILAIRHTKVDLPEGICYGHSDVNLVPDFEIQFSKLKSQLNDYSISETFSSPMSRCKLLANYLSPVITVDDRLREMNFGDWELQKWDQISDSYIYKWYSDYYNLPCPNGESMTNLMARTSSFLNGLKNSPSSSILIITHSGVIRCMHHLINSIPVNELFNITVPFGSISIFNL